MIGHTAQALRAFGAFHRMKIGVFEPELTGNWIGKWHRPERIGFFDAVGIAQIPRQVIRVAKYVARSARRFSIARR